MEALLTESLGFGKVTRGTGGRGGGCISQVRLPLVLSFITFSSTENKNGFQGSRYKTENGGDIFVKENPKGEAAKKMFDGEMCSLQVFLKENCDIF